MNTYYESGIEQSPPCDFSFKNITQIIFIHHLTIK